MTTPPMKYERRWWHYMVMAMFLLTLFVAFVMVAAELWIEAVILFLYATALGFQTWWIFVDIPSKWPYGPNP